MNSSTRALNAAAGVISQAMKTAQTSMGVAFALDSAQLLMSPKTAAELADLRALADESGKGTRQGGLTWTPDGQLVLYRAAYEHDITPLEIYQTRAAARAHCEAEARLEESRERPGCDLLWAADPEEPGVEELHVSTGPDDIERTGYTVQAVEVPAAYDPETDQ